VADACFILSDPGRRREYDSLYGSKKQRTEDPSASANFFTNFANMFGGKGTEAAPENTERPDADHMFADVFEEVSGLRIITGFSGV
jgi:DnaJ-class molecular chaperone